MYLNQDYIVLWWGNYSISAHQEHLVMRKCFLWLNMHLWTIQFTNMHAVTHTLVDQDETCCIYPSKMFSYYCYSIKCRLKYWFLCTSLPLSCVLRFDAFVHHHENSLITTSLYYLHIILIISHYSFLIMSFDSWGIKLCSSNCYFLYHNIHALYCVDYMRNLHIIL